VIAAVEYASKSSSSSRRVHHRHVQKPSTLRWTWSQGRMLARAERLDVAGKALRAVEDPLDSSQCLLAFPVAYCSWAMG
jgi:hypothetical protein